MALMRIEVRLPFLSLAEISPLHHVDLETKLNTSTRPRRLESIESAKHGAKPSLAEDPARLWKKLLKGRERATGNGAAFNAEHYLQKVLAHEESKLARRRKKKVCLWCRYEVEN